VCSPCVVVFNIEAAIMTSCGIDLQTVGHVTLGGGERHVPW
jgi:hypothetical protein